METIALYIQTWVRSLRAREQGDEATEDALLEQLDNIWLQMTPTQVATIDTLSKALVDQKITLDDLESLTQWLLRASLNTPTQPYTRSLAVLSLFDTARSTARAVYEPSMWTWPSRDRTTTVHRDPWPSPKPVPTIEVSECQFATR